MWIVDQSLYIRPVTSAFSSSPVLSLIPNVTDLVSHRDVVLLPAPFPCHPRWMATTTAEDVSAEECIRHFLHLSVSLFNLDP